METEMSIIEVNGVKMEVDLRHAKVIHQNLRVGSKVKILEKGAYDGPEVYPGVVVGFEPFTDLPTIIVGYIKNDWSNAGLHFAYVNSKSADKWDMVPAVDDELPIAKGDVLDTFDRDIGKKEAELADMRAKRDFFLRHFERWFVATETL